MGRHRETASVVCAVELNYDGNGTNAFYDNGAHGAVDLEQGKEAKSSDDEARIMLARLEADGYTPRVCRRNTLRGQIARTTEAVS